MASLRQSARTIVLCALVMLAPAQLAVAQGARELPTVTILTDALDGDSPASLAVSQLARALSGDRRMRVLAIAGRGGRENVQDLLYFRGVDFSILNSDALVASELPSQIPDADRRVRQFAHLFDRKIYLLARAGIERLADLSGRCVAAVGREAGGLSTTRAILGLERIEARLKLLPVSGVIDQRVLADCDAVLLVGEELSRLRPEGTGLKLVAIPLSERLATAYKGGRIGAEELPAPIGGKEIATLERSTLLATFRWTPSHSRYPALRAFLTAFYDAVAGLRAEPGSIWRQSDITAAVPGFTFHPLAVPAQFLPPSQVAGLATAEKLLVRPATVAEVAVPQPAAANHSAPQRSATPAAGTASGESRSPAPLRLSAVTRQPLADPRSATGGLVIDLLARALGETAQSGQPRTSLAATWTANTSAAMAALTNAGAVDLSAPWLGVDCDRPNDLTGSASMLCDEAILSEPIMRVAYGLFAPEGKPMALANPAEREGRTVCLTADDDATLLASDGRSWLAGKGLSMIRRSTVVDCVAAIESKEADAFVAIDFEGLDTLARLGLSGRFKQQAQPLGTRGVHVAVARRHPQAQALVEKVNVALKALKSTDAYSSIIRQHLIAYWGAGQPTTLR